MGTELSYRFAGLVLMAAMFSLSAFFRRRADRAGGSIPRGEGSYLLLPLRLFGLLMMLIFLTYLINPQWTRWSALPLPEWSRWTGAALAAAMLPLIFWMFQSLGHNITPTAATRKNHHLVTTGPYRWIRHPLYSFATICWIGFSLLAANWFVLVLLLLGSGLLIKRTAVEEAHLVERFGDQYRDYMRRTGRFFPRFWV